ncbi:hypothetical protein TNCV_1470361 [Trichonephila clavipes]|nr:hypothetical protein TNCV_1470361 [Trichonephila clavipes]
MMDMSLRAYNRVRYSSESRLSSMLVFSSGKKPDFLTRNGIQPQMESQRTLLLWSADPHLAFVLLPKTVLNAFKRKEKINEDFCRIICDLGSLVVQVTDSWSACHEFEPVTAENPPCRRTLSMSRLKRSPVGLVWKL